MVLYGLCGPSGGANLPVVNVTFLRPTKMIPGMSDVVV